MTDALSYDFAEFAPADRQSELARLRRQATVLLERELTVLRGVGLAVGAATAEIGCGPGFVTGAIAGAVAPGVVIGLDRSTDLLGVARATVAPEHDNLTFRQGDAYDTGLDAQSLDFVYSRMLYQHLDAPLKALVEAKRILRPGGRVCVADVDDSWLTLQPSCAAFERLTRAAQAGQLRRGGDRHIGRKLPALLREAGFTEVTLDVVAVSSLELGITTFLDLTTRFKAIQAGGADELIEEVYRFAAQQDVVGVAGVFVVSGVAG